MEHNHLWGDHEEQLGGGPTLQMRPEVIRGQCFTAQLWERYTSIDYTRSVAASYPGKDGPDSRKSVKILEKQIPHKRLNHMTGSCCYQDF